MRKILQAGIFWRSLLKLSPLLALYLLFCIVNNKQALRADESRYLVYAHNILKGCFATPESMMFWNGPGYPLFLAPFIALKLPLLIPRLANAFLLFFTIAYFHGALTLMGVGKRALMYAYLMGSLLLLHGPLMDLLMSESLSVFLVSGSAYHFFSLVKGHGRHGSHLLATGLLLGFLAMTKVIFGYALEVSLLVALGFWMGKKWFGHFEREGSRRSASGSAVQVCALALLVCFPYLANTWSVTGKINYWGNSGGLQLYCLTVPEPELTGDWLNFDMVRYNPEFFPVQGPFFQELSRLDYIPRDEAFRHAAMENLKSHPGKFFWNWRANVNRMVFGFPVSPYPGSDSELATGNRSFAYAMPFLLFMLALIPGWLGRKSIPNEAHAALIFAAISLGGLSLLSCIPRQAFPLLPLLGVWTVLVVEKALVWKRKADPVDILEGGKA